MVKVRYSLTDGCNHFLSLLCSNEELKLPLTAEDGAFHGAHYSPVQGESAQPSMPTPTSHSSVSGIPVWLCTVSRGSF